MILGGSLIPLRFLLSLMMIASNVHQTVHAMKKLNVGSAIVSLRNVLFFVQIMVVVLFKRSIQTMIAATSNCLICKLIRVASNCF